MNMMNDECPQYTKTAALCGRAGCRRKHPCSGDGGGVQEAQLVTRGQGAVSLDTRLNGVTIATQTLALD